MGVVCRFVTHSQMECAIRREKARTGTDSGVVSNAIFCDAGHAGKGKIADRSYGKASALFANERLKTILIIGRSRSYWDG
jgi:hypothetical protein